MECQRHSLVDGTDLVREYQSKFPTGLEFSPCARSHSYDLFCGIGEYPPANKYAALSVSIVITDSLPFSPYLYSLQYGGTNR